MEKAGHRSNNGRRDHWVKGKTKFKYSIHTNGTRIDTTTMKLITITDLK